MLGALAAVWINGPVDFIDSKTAGKLPKAEETQFCSLPLYFTLKIVFSYRFFMICCTFFPLNQAQYLGVATVHPGEIYSGGETPDGQFDYIRNVVPISYSNGSVVGYELEIGRFGCPCREAEEVQPVYSPPYFMVSYSNPKWGKSSYFSQVMATVECLPVSRLIQTLSSITGKSNEWTRFPFKTLP